MDIWIDFSLARLYFVSFDLAAAAQTWNLSNAYTSEISEIFNFTWGQFFWTSAICDKYPVCCCSVNISFKIEQHNIFLTSQDIGFHLISTAKRIFTLEREVLVECNWIISTFPKKFFLHSIARWQREMKEARGGEHRNYKGCGREWDPVWFGWFEAPAPTNTTKLQQKILGCL